MTTISEKTAETIATLKLMGIKFNIVTKVDHRVELHYEWERLNGKSEVHFVAELDGYGNITEFGPYWPENEDVGGNIALTPEGEVIRV